MPKLYNGQTVLEAALDRLIHHYAAGDTVVYSTSGGKDSTVIMELGVMAARQVGCLPIQVVTRDEEIMPPGTFEYLERVRERTDEINLHWLIAGQPIINAFNRYNPYWWVFDPLEQDKWVRQPPAFAEWIPEQHIGAMTTPARFPTPADKKLVAVIGLRTQESLTRMSRIASTRGALTKHPTEGGAYNLAPIYDWQDDDVWKFIKDYQLDYNTAYDTLFRVGVPKPRQRIAPPSMRQQMSSLKYYMMAWPKWFDKVERRLPGMRMAARYGRHALRPTLQPGETWEARMYRIIEEARRDGAGWLADRAEIAVQDAVQRHAVHSSSPLPQTASKRCRTCPPFAPGSWEGLAVALYNGDPWSTTCQRLSPLEPYVLRPGARPWSESGKKVSLHW